MNLQLRLRVPEAGDALNNRENSFNHNLVLDSEWVSVCTWTLVRDEVLVDFRAIPDESPDEFLDEFVL